MAGLAKTGTHGLWVTVVARADLRSKPAMNAAFAQAGHLEPPIAASSSSAILLRPIVAGTPRHAVFTR